MASILEKLFVLRLQLQNLEALQISLPVAFPVDGGLSARIRESCIQQQELTPTVSPTASPETLPHHEEQQLMPLRSQSHANAKFMGPLPTEYAMTP